MTFQRSSEALPEPLQRVRCTEEVTAVAHLDVSLVRKAALVDVQGRELVPQQVQELAVGGELLEGGDQPAFEPAGGLPADVGAGEERRTHGVERLVARLEVNDLAGGQRPATGPPRQTETAGDLPR